MKKKFVLMLILALACLSFSACGNVEFKITFVVDGAVYKTIQTNGNETIKMPDDPQKDGYTFKGWYWDEGTWQLRFTAQSLLTAPLSANMSVYAKWESDAPENLESYSLKGMTVKSTIIGDYFIDPDDMTDEQKQQYDSMIGMYGRTVGIGSEAMRFDGLVLGQFNPALYSLNGKNVIFADLSLKSTFNYVTLENGLFCLGLDFGGNGLVLEYHSQQYTAPKYTAQFDYNQATDGDELAEESFDFNAVLGLLPQPRRTGYTFDGWFYDGKKVDQDTKYTWKKDITLKAQWTANRYEVTFEYDGATAGDSVKSQSITFDTAFSNLPKPTRTNYIFGGWYIEPFGAGDKFENGTAYTIAGDSILYAHWIGGECTLNFDYQGATSGDSLQNKSVTYSEPVGELPVPEKTGNVFMGWFAGVGGSGEQYDSDTAYWQEAGITLYAKWEATLTFDYQGATAGNTQATEKAYYNGYLGQLPQPTRPGYTFSAWYTQPFAGGTSILPYSTFKLDGSATLYAAWYAEILFDYQNATSGNNIPETLATLGKPLGSLPTPTRTGYTFGGWYSQAGGGGDQYTENTVFNNADGGMTLFASWTANTYTVRFDAQGGSVDPSDITVTYNAAVGALPQPSKTGNTFDGWFTQSVGGGVQYDASAVYRQTSDLTLYAKWTTTITYLYDGATSGNTEASVSVVYGALIPTLPRPFKQGYSFEGWYNGSEQYLAGASFTSHTPISLTAKWIEGTDKSYFTYTKTVDSVTVTGLSASGSSLTEISIPAIIDKLAVKIVGENAFLNKTGIVKITLPQSLLTIGNYAFSGTGLTAVVVPDSVTAIGNGAFKNTPMAEISVPFVGNTKTATAQYSVFGYIFGYSTSGSSGGIQQISVNGNYYYYFIPSTLRKVTVTGTITALPALAFYNCTMLTEVNLPAGVTEVKKSTFAGCTNLTNVTGLEAVVKVGDYGFSNCAKLASVNDLASLQSIGEYALYNCKLLASVSLADNLTAIGSNAFANCSGLLQVILPQSLVTIGEYAFSGTGLTAVVVPDSVTVIGRGAFKGTPMTEISVPYIGYTKTSGGYSSVFGYIFDYDRSSTSGGIQQISIDGNPYYYFIPSTLRKVTVTATITALPAYAFNNCTMLTEVNLPAGVTEVKNNTFAGCTNLTSVTGLEAVNTVGNYSFASCTKLASVNDLASLKSIGSNAFRNCKLLASVSLADDLVTIGEFTFAGTGLTVVVVPDSVTSIGNGAFNGTLMVEISVPFVGNTKTATAQYSVFGYIFGYERAWAGTIPDGAIEQIRIGGDTYAYYVPSTLRKVTITGAITALPAFAFNNCTMLTEVNLPESLTEIKDSAFANCTIKELVIPEGVTTIAKGALRGCTAESLTLSLLGTYDQNTHSYIKYLYNANGYSDSAITVPYLRNVYVTGSVTSVSNYAFYGLAGLEKVVLPASIESIGISAFANCAKLTVLKLTSVTPPSTGANWLSGVSGGLIISVPAAALSDYKNDAAFGGYTVVADNSAAIVFNSMGGSAVESIISDAPAVPTEPPAPVWNNRIFKGWYTDRSYTTAFDFSAELSQTVILFARWELVAAPQDTQIDVSITTAGDACYYTFRPATSGKFKVVVSGASATAFASLSTAGGTLIKSGTGTSFEVVFDNLTANTNYTLCVKMNNAAAVGTFSFTLANA